MYAFEHNFFIIIKIYWYIHFNIIILIFYIHTLLHIFSSIQCCSQKECFNKHFKRKINNKNVTQYFNDSMLMLSKCEENNCRLYLHMSNLWICWNVVCFYFSFVNLSLILLNCLHGLSFHWFALIVVFIFNFF